MKEFKTYNEQIEILKSRGLKFNDENKAIDIIRKENYYFIINAYKKHFLSSNETNDEIYLNDVYFLEIHSLYEFDKKLRHLLLKKILPLENNIKAISAYYIAQKHGTLEDNYLNEKNYQKKDITKSILNSIKGKINIFKKRNNQIKHYIEKHQYIPPWVLFPVMDLGDFSKLFEIMDYEVQSKIINKFKIEEIKYLNRFLPILTLFRNFSAHNSRIYNLKSDKWMITRESYLNFKNYSKGKNKLFSIIIIFKKMLSEDDFQGFFDEFKIEINKLKKNINNESFEKIKKEMGLPENWQEIENL